MTVAPLRSPLRRALPLGITLLGVLGCDSGVVGMDEDASAPAPTPDGRVTTVDSGIVAPDAAGPVSCGDGVCSPGENAVECPVDCFAGSAMPAITVGSDHSCARTLGSTVQCWGYNRYGQLGDATTNDADLPQSVTALSDVAAVDAGRLHTCALRDDGTVWCWGQNHYGQLGFDTPDGQTSTPGQVPGITDAVALAAGGKHTCVLRADHVAWCWGANTFGQLGDATWETRQTPGAVLDLPTVVDLAAGRDHTCALEENGKVWCWGRNDDGQLGDGAWEAAHLPGLVATLPAAMQLDAGARHTCAMLGDDTARCWGDNSALQLGLTGLESYQLPTPMGDGWLGTSVAGGEDQTCLVRDDTTLWCWGAVGVSGLESAEPRPVDGLVHVTAASLGSDHGCAAVAGNGVWCWGRNDHGQLGDGTHEPHATPVRVYGL